MATESELERLKDGISRLNATIGGDADADGTDQTPTALAEKAVSYLGKDGLEELISLISSIKAQSAVADGVYAAHTLDDGTEKLVAYDDLPDLMPVEQYPGVVVVEGGRAVLVAKEDCASGVRWGATGDTHGAMTVDVSQLWHDFDGHLNTALANIAGVGYGMETVHSYSFGHLGVGRWHMGSGGEWRMVVKRYDEVQSMLSRIGGTPFTDGYYYWTSTQYDDADAWLVCPSSGACAWDAKSLTILDGGFNSVRAFAAFSLNA